MSIAAVMVTFHTGDVLWACVDAAVAQCDAVVVVDNGNPAEVSARLQSDPRLHYLGGHGNIGFASACNLGAREVPEHDVFILNPDALLGESCAAKLAQVAAQAPVPALVGARLVDGAGTELRGSRRRTLTPLNLLRGLNLHRRLLPSGPVEVGAVSGAAVLLTRESWNALGGFDDHYFLHVEDLDLARRTRDMGGVCLFVPDAEVVHPGSTSEAESWVVETHKLMGLRRYLTTHHPVLGRLLMPAIHLAFRGRTRPS